MTMLLDISGQRITINDAAHAGARPSAYRPMRTMNPPSVSRRTGRGPIGLTISPQGEARSELMTASTAAPGRRQAV
jgi:hypothetical protein